MSDEYAAGDHKAIHRSSTPDPAIEWRWRPAAVAWTLPTLLKENVLTGAVARPAVVPINLTAVVIYGVHKALRQLNKTSLTRKMGVLLPTGFDRITAWSGRKQQESEYESEGKRRTVWWLLAIVVLGLAIWDGGSSMRRCELPDAGRFAKGSPAGALTGKWMPCEKLTSAPGSADG